MPTFAHQRCAGHAPPKRQVQIYGSSHPYIYVFRGATRAHAKALVPARASCRARKSASCTHRPWPHTPAKKHRARMRRSRRCGSVWTRPSVPFQMVPVFSSLFPLPPPPPLAHQLPTSHARADLGAAVQQRCAHRVGGRRA
eukprot:50541-Chlamydomonas_euryale.AAC.1